MTENEAAPDTDKPDADESNTDAPDAGEYVDPFADVDVSALVPEPPDEQAPVDARCGTFAAGLRWAASVRDGRYRPFAAVHAVVLAADHGVAALDVSPEDPARSAERARAAATGAGPLAELAAAAGAVVRVVDTGLDVDPIEGLSDRRIRRGSAILGRADVLTIDEAADAIALGRAIADEAVDAGADLLVPCLVGVGASTPAAAMAAATLYEEPTAVTGRVLRADGRIDDDTWMRRCAAIRDGLRRGRPHAQDAHRLLAASGGTDLAAAVGLLIQAAVRRTPVLLDGPAILASALVAMRVAPTASGWWWAPQLGEDPVERFATDALYLSDPAARFGLSLGDGTGALALLPLLTMMLQQNNATGGADVVPAAPGEYDAT